MVVIGNSVLHELMTNSLRLSRSALVVSVIVSLLVTLLTGLYPEHGGGPGSTRTSYGLPLSWRVKVSPSSIPIYDLIELDDGRVEARLSPSVGSGKTRTTIHPFYFGLDVAVWCSVFAAAAYTSKYATRKSNSSDRDV